MTKPRVHLTPKTDFLALFVKATSQVVDVCRETAFAGHDRAFAHRN